MAVVAAVAACAADLALGAGAGTAVGAGATVAVVGAAATVLKVTASHVPAASRRAGALGQPGGREQLRLQWLTALEVRGIRPFLDQQRVLSASAGAKQGAPQLRRTDKSAAARRRNVLEQSFRAASRAGQPFTGRRTELCRVAQWVQAARASTETKPTVVVLHGAPGFRPQHPRDPGGAQPEGPVPQHIVVDLRGDSTEEPPLTTRDAMLHLLNRLGAPREQLLFRERSSQDQQVRRLGELYHQHLTGLPVTIVLDDASDAEQVRALVPERSDSLVLGHGPQTARPARRPPRLGAPAPVDALDAAGAEELLNAAAQEKPDPYDAEASDQVRELCGSLPRPAHRGFLPRPADPASTGLRPRRVRPRGAGRQDVAALHRPDRHGEAPAAPAGAGRPGLARRRRRCLPVGDGRTEATRHLTALAQAGLIDHVRGSRYRLHDLVRGFAQARLLDEEEPSEQTAAQERLIVNYAELADSVIRLVDGKTSTRADQFGPHGFTYLDAALRWLDDESSFITAALRHAEGVKPSGRPRTSSAPCATTACCAATSTAWARSAS